MKSRVTILGIVIVTVGVEGCDKPSPAPPSPTQSASVDSKWLALLHSLPEGESRRACAPPEYAGEIQVRRILEQKLEGSALAEKLSAYEPDWRKCFQYEFARLTTNDRDDVLVRLGPGQMFMEYWVTFDLDTGGLKDWSCVSCLLPLASPHSNSSVTISGRFR